jgi:hypothetical protein
VTRNGIRTSAALELARAADEVVLVAAVGVAAESVLFLNR